MSPLWNHPSASMALAVSSGLRKYSLNVVVERISSVEPGAYRRAAPTTESPEFLLLAGRGC